MTQLPAAASSDPSAATLGTVPARVVAAARRLGISVPLAGVLAILVVLAGFQQSGHPAAFAITIGLCVAAAASSRWPAPAGAAVGAFLTVLIFVPIDWVGVSVHAFLIPIIVTVVAHRTRLAWVWTIWYLLALAGITVRRVDANDPSGLVAYLASWVAMAGIAWLIAINVRVIIRAREDQRELEVRRQRVEIARELHDTVARELTMISMRVQRVQEAGGSTREDLEFITNASLEAQNGLRSMMSLLRDTGLGDHSAIESGMELQSALEASRRRLESDGFTVNTTISGDLEQMSPAVRVVLGRVCEEATANILRHAEPGTAVAVMAEIGPVMAEMAFFNTPKANASKDSRRKSLGLVGARERLQALGGELNYGMGAAQWYLEARVPIQ